MTTLLFGQDGSGQEPDFRLAGLSLWVSGRQFPGSNDRWDGNWLNAGVRVEAIGAVVEAQGPIVRSDDLASFAQALEKVDRSLDGEARLDCIEPTLSIRLSCNRRTGQVEIVVSVTPDHMMQQHTFKFSSDQTILRPTISALGRIIAEYPVKTADFRPSDGKVNP